ncbi:MAG: hypothetical protein KIT89_06625 [Microcella sp.]|uniref:hypothetical protein n=1 Tax=Microcella sp. TaxID=1913979 RepID=UPI0024C5D1AA|nr:hypothetical protein [Microcella sp.]UYN84823.1 MAG: hypothetical protein KIT89_06625 [Microcella sp.]
MILRLDDRRPIVWRTPHCVQIGVDPVAAVLDGVSDGDARLIAALGVGASREALRALGAQAEVPPHRVDEVLTALAPALEREQRAPRAAQRPPLAIVGSGAMAARVAGVLGEAGHPVAVGASVERVGGRRPAAAVLVSAHVVDPLAHQRWLRRDIAHLPIVFGEVAVTIGPLVVPGRTACLTCAERHRAARDEAWPAIAAQLWGRSASTETVALATEAAIEAARLLRKARNGTAVRLDTETSDRTENDVSGIEQCGCRELSAAPAPEPRRETGSRHALRATTTGAAPTTVRAPFALA